MRRTVEALGFVQVDSIQAVERAHHHILHTRLDGYRPAQLTRLLEHERALFEHWTHDASAIRADWLPMWRHRFAAWGRRHRSPRVDRWLQARIGPEPDRVLRAVLRRITREGPLGSRDFAEPPPEGGNGWWNWKPARAALELLWRSGKLSVAGRRQFHKLYDRTERVFPELPRTRKPSAAAHRDWAARTALERLGVATPTEIARFLRAIPRDEAATWCTRAARRGEIVPVQVESDDGSKPRAAFAPAGWRERVAKLPAAPDRTRLLSPFDPLIHDRARAQRLFGFDYRIECFVPAPRRRYGYYVLPILEGERFVGRLDPKLDRERDVLLVRRVWWEPGVRSTRARRRALETALDRFRGQLGAERVELPRGS